MSLESQQKSVAAFAVLANKPIVNMGEALENI
jgi:hypothetical protein